MSAWDDKRIPGVGGRGEAPGGSAPTVPTPAPPSTSAAETAPSASEAGPPSSTGAAPASSSGGVGSDILLPAPTVSLPKGGGAIKGMGEKFQANPVTGTGSTSIPIPTTPGRSGFGPELSLSYDSGSGNGPFGLGWKVGIASIRRKTDRGLPRYHDGVYVDAPDSDVYVFSEAEDLVPLRTYDESKGAWELNERTEGGYFIRRYRPRVEGAFARIERWTDTSDNTSHWRTWSAGNIRRIYGLSANARVVDPDDSTRIFEWLLQEARDELGNLIRYEYKTEDDTGVDPATPVERSRSLAGHGCTHRYPKRIAWTTLTNSPTEPIDPAQWAHLLVFDYGEHLADDPTPKEATTWSLRDDPFSSFRSGFDIRCRRLCQRILHFHNFSELGTSPVVVRSTELSHTASSVATRLTSVTQRGWEKQGGSYTSETLQPVTFAYADATIDPTVQELSGLDDLPRGFDPSRFRWVDLDGEGLSGLLTAQAGAWYYKRNEGNGTLGAIRCLDGQPSIPLGQARLMDLGGDGRLDLVATGPTVPGYQPRDPDGDWERFRRFVSVPTVSLDDPDVRLIDLDGDGHADLLVTEDEVFRWYPSLGKDGFDAPKRTFKQDDEEQGPTCVFSSDRESIFLADMTGDGLTDLVRIRNSSVCYWPNRGYGRFGARVVMGNAPHFDSPDRFQAARIRLADIDGSGPTDLLYLGPDHVRLWANQSGNAWSSVIDLTRLPGVDDAATIQVADLLGDGTACLVWSSTLPGESWAPIRYVHLMSAGKPHLLTSMTNNLGRQTLLTYTPSTSFYLADRQAGTPWATRLSFPVQCLSQVEVRDEITGWRFVSQYAYHHGYFDGPEREFRGFGMVEQWDAESVSDWQDSNPDNDDLILYVPPVHTKTWFHTGAWVDGSTLSAAYATEYFSGDASAAQLPDTILPEDLSADELREACRALKGRMLRQEVYADDASASEDHPYTVTEQSFALRRLQPVDGEVHGSFVVVPLETMAWHYERDAMDPRVAHTLTLETNDYGQVLRSAAVSYPRRVPGAGMTDEQGATHVVLTATDYINQDDLTTSYHIGLAYRTRTWEMTGLGYGDDTAPFTIEGLLEELDGSPVAEEIPFEQAPSGTDVQIRALSEVRTTYWNDTLTAEFSLGMLGSRALVYQRYQKVMTDGLVTEVYGTRVTSSILADECGYTELDGDQWTPSGTQTFDPTRYYLPIAHTDAWGNTTDVTWDSHTLAITEVIAPPPFDASPEVRNTVTADIDYRTMQPWKVSSPNQNANVVRFDALGRVVATAVIGRLGEGDTLGDPTTEITYELTRWQSRGKPNRVHTRAREEHGPSSPDCQWMETYVYSDGGGNVVSTKVQAEPGTAYYVDGGDLKQTYAEPRWVGTGRTVLNNKGKPVKQYEPFFSTTHEYEDEDDLVQWGVTPVLHYDPLGRNTQVDLPNGTERRVVFDAWQQAMYDENDSVVGSDWWEARQPDASPPMSAAEQRAATLAEQHDDTPTVVHLDPLGRTFLTVLEVDASPQTFLETRLTLDVQGNPRVVNDARGLDIQSQRFDMVKRSLYTDSADAGETWALSGVAGQPIRTWKSEGLAIRRQYDGMRRPTHLWVEERGIERLAERTVYGESLSETDALDGNLYGRNFRAYDGAGVHANEAFDFKGNVLEQSRRMRLDVDLEPDWTPLATSNDAYEIEVDAAFDLEGENFVTQATYDALNRVVTQTTPDDSVTEYTYNEAGLLETVDVDMRNSGTLTPFVTGIAYNTRGQRESISYGNGVDTEYSYDPYTFRLTRILTTRPASPEDVLQDLRYTYDPVGNVVEVVDEAQDTLFFANQAVTPSSRYEYDAIYRLVQATGRERIASGQVDHGEPAFGSIPDPSDPSAVRRYTEQYVYDEVGNFEYVKHIAAGGSWTRYYETATDSNRLLSTSLPGDNPAGPYGATYGHDDRGNMVDMPHLGSPYASPPGEHGLEYDFRGQIRYADLGAGNDAVYHYDSGGQRLRKVVRRGVNVEERIYLGGWEVYRKRVAGSLDTERETLHVMDGKQRVAIVETLTVDAGKAVGSPTPRPRYQLSNHLSTACLEVDADAAIITYEEYHPYGTTSWHASKSSSEVSQKRYRYTGKERDDETGLYYHGARNFACWLGRWSSADPVRGIDGRNLYEYVSSSPVCLRDPLGLQEEDDDVEPAAPIVVWDEEGDIPAGYEPVEIDPAARSSLEKGWDLYTSFDDEEDAGAPFARELLRHRLLGFGNPFVRRNKDWSDFMLERPEIQRAAAHEFYLAARELAEIGGHGHFEMTFEKGVKLDELWSTINTLHGPHSVEASGYYSVYEDEGSTNVTFSFVTFSWIDAGDLHPGLVTSGPDGEPMDDAEYSAVGWDFDILIEFYMPGSATWIVEGKEPRPVVGWPEITGAPRDPQYYRGMPE